MPTPVPMRPRERYGHHGPGGFGDAELLALVIGTGTPRRSAAEIAAGLLARFGSLDALAHSHPVQLAMEDGVGPARAVRLHAALEVGRRSLRSPDRAVGAVHDATDAHELLGPPLAGLVDEELHALFLDRRRRPLARRMLTRGSDGFTVVDPRQVFREAIALRASAVILGHNHPSGDPTPSAQDRDVTRRVAAAGRILGVPLLDHLVVGGERFVSLAELGELTQWEGEPPVWTAQSR